ncbi:MAG TPA: DUF3187 family protein [Steroidobacteraceae bacterium]|nr:DUF3187 family protein [Steroidobacteraceae bacterium]
MDTVIRFLSVAAVCFVVPAANAAGTNEWDYFGLLRARDLTPFGFLRLDMRPTHARIAQSSGWSIESELAYQNTWALSPEVERYLGTLQGRREIGPAELAAIRALPGENYLADFELALLDVTLQYKFSSQWAGYVVLSGVHYGGGFLDGTIEKFHDTFGFSDFGRPAVVRNGTSYILDLKNSQVALFEAPTSGGLLDPTFGLRYSGITLGKDWKVILEAAAKVPVRGREDLLSTGRTDYGMQMTLQKFAGHHAWYAAGSAVYYAGSPNFAPNDSKIIPTLVVGYERQLTANTHAILQGYASPSVYSHRDTDLDDLLATKYQLSLGVYHRIGAGLISFAVTENLQNLNNTPDIGFQLGFAFGRALLAPQ